jgi:hypothetical protein
MFRQFKALVFVPPSKVTEAYNIIVDKMEEHAQVKPTTLTVLQQKIIRHLQLTPLLKIHVYTNTLTTKK